MSETQIIEIATTIVDLEREMEHCSLEVLGPDIPRCERCPAETCRYRDMHHNWEEGCY